jgi:hypothetical protein
MDRHLWRMVTVGSSPRRHCGFTTLLATNLFSSCIRLSQLGYEVEALLPFSYYLFMFVGLC